MPAKKKTNRKTKVKTKKGAGMATGKGKRLSAEEKQAIMAEPLEATLATLAEKYSTTINTIGRYRKGIRAARKGGKTKLGRPVGKTAVKDDVPMISAEGEYIVLRFHRSSIMRQVLGSLID